MRRRPLAVVALGLALALAAGACSDDPPPDWLVERATPTTTAPPPTTSTTTLPTPTEPGRTVAVADLTPGLCIDDASPFTGSDVNQITQIRALPCRLPHEAEVFAAATLPARPGAAFPGQGRLRTVAQELCRDRFQGFVGIPWTSSELEIAALWPSPPSWQEGDRAVVCAVFRLDGERLTGSARGSEL